MLSDRYSDTTPYVAQSSLHHPRVATGSVSGVPEAQQSMPALPTTGVPSAAGSQPAYQASAPLKSIGSEKLLGTKPNLTKPSAQSEPLKPIGNVDSIKPAGKVESLEPFAPTIHKKSSTKLTDGKFGVDNDHFNPLGRTSSHPVADLLSLINVRLNITRVVCMLLRFIMSPMTTVETSVLSFGSAALT